MAPIQYLQWPDAAVGFTWEEKGPDERKASATPPLKYQFISGAREPSAEATPPSLFFQPPAQAKASPSNSHYFFTINGETLILKGSAS